MKKDFTHSHVGPSPERLRQWQEATSKAVGHKVGLSRRDLLAHGFYAAAATMLVPSIWTKAQAADCGGGASTNNLPFLTFDMAGGAALAGNVLVGKTGGAKDLLRAYDILGWDPRAAGSLDERFGLPMSKANSKLLAGMIGAMSPEAQARLRLGSVCHFSQLDTSNNKMNIAGLVSAAGAVGATVSKGFSLKPTASGGNSDVVTAFPTLTPISAKSVDDIVGAARFGGVPLSGLTPAQRAELATRARDASVLQSQALKAGRGADLLRDLAACVYEKNQQYANGGENALDPRTDAIAQAVFGITAATATTSMDAVAAGIIVNAIQAKSGPGVWTLGDCDYHTGSQTKGDTQDGTMGTMIGRAVEYAHRAGKPLFFQLITDGSCSANRGTRNWSQDTNEGVMLFGYYSPQGAPQYVRDGVVQLGAFTDGQTVDRTTIVGAAARTAALSVFANYCNVANKMAAFEQLAPNSFSAADLRSLLLFKGQGTT
jgi:hypothetical protein